MKLKETLLFWKVNLTKFNDYIKGINLRMKEILSFTKTFKYNEFSTIYCEREWRSKVSFNFEINDIAFIIIPKTKMKNSHTNYYENFIENYVGEKKLINKIPVLPWEDLIEY